MIETKFERLNAHESCLRQSFFFNMFSQRVKPKELKVCIYQYQYLSIWESIEIKNNKARHNLSNVKYRQMAFRLVDGAVIGSFLEPLG